ncbi:MAG: ABC transporter ATP-binding protein [bacterium JZ-2024 1]
MNYADDSRPEDLRVTRALLWNTLRYARPYAGLFLLSVILSLLLTGIDLSLPHLVRVSIDRHILKQVVVRRQAAGEACIPFGDGWCGVPAGSSAEKNLAVVYYVLRAEVSPESFFDSLVQSLEGRPGVAIYPLAITVTPEALRSLPENLRASLRASDWLRLRTLAVIFFALVFLSFIFNYFNSLILARAGQGIVRDIRNTAFRHLLTRHISYFHRNPVGRLVTRVTNDVEAISDFFTLVLSTSIKDLLLIAGIAVLMFQMNLRLTLHVMALVPILLALSLVFRRHIVVVFRKVRTRIAELNAYLSESLSGIRVIKLYRKEHAGNERFGWLSRHAYQANMEAITLFSAFQPTINFLNLFAVGLILWIGGRDVLAGQMSVGTLVAFISYVQMFYAPISDLAEKYNLFQQAMAGAEKVQTLLNVQEEIPAPVAPFSPPQVRGEIRVNQVSFGYIPGQEVLHNISFEVPEGSIVALVGHTGAGKSSLISLILRLYDPWSGSILLDGKDLREWEPQVLRKSVALVPQDVFLFSESVRANIGLWDQEISDDRLLEALRAVQAESIVSRLNGGLEAILAERGQTLSTGERQLLAFARALAANPRVLILDEATASIDPATESKIQHALQILLKGRTAIVIAHRLTTIRQAHRIIVLNQGRVVESGTHEQLLALRKYYYALYRTQFQPVRTEMHREDLHRRELIAKE